MHWRWVLVIVAAGCTSSVSGTATPDAAHEQTLPDGPCGVERVTGTLPGVTVSIRSDSCVYHQGEIATLAYEITVDTTTPTIVIPADPPGGCGTCVSATNDPLSFLWATIAGEALGPLYCPGYAALGCCPAHDELHFDLDRGTFTRSIEWSGRTLDCPSDTGRHEGDYFPPGVYAARADVDGYAAGVVAASLPIEMLRP